MEVDGFHVLAAKALTLKKQLFCKRKKATWRYLCKNDEKNPKHADVVLPV